MAIFTDEEKDSTKVNNGAPDAKSYQSTSGIDDGYVTDLGAKMQLPKFLPKELIDLGVCKSEDDLKATKQHLADFRKVVQWTKQKYAAQQTAADLALELAKSRNALVAHFAKTMMKQAQSETELAALLQAMPDMISALSGQVAAKKEKRVRSFTERIANAGQGKKQTKAK